MGYASVVVGTDGSATAEQAVRAAAELAAGGSLVVVTAYTAGTGGGPTDRLVSTAPARREADAVAARGRAVAEAAGARHVGARAAEGPPADVLLAVADELRADLVVVGSLGMTGASRFALGGVANDVTHRAGCDVLVVHTGD